MCHPSLIGFIAGQFDGPAQLDLIKLLDHAEKLRMNSFDNGGRRLPRSVRNDAQTNVLRRGFSRDEIFDERQRRYVIREQDHFPFPSIISFSIKKKK